MTYIEIAGSDEDLQELKLLSEQIFRENKVQAKSKIVHFNQDSFESEQLLPTLQVFFSGIFAVSSLINLAINIKHQKQKRKISNNSNTPFYIKIKTSNNQELELKISGEATEEKNKYYQKLVQNFVNDFLSADDEFSLKKLDFYDIEKNNLLFKKLENQLTDVRILVSLPAIISQDTTIINLNFEKINLFEAIRIGINKTFYLKIDEVEHCKNIFYILERENILSFHEISTDVRTILIGKELIGFVGYRVEILSLFNIIICNNSFTYCEKFKVEDIGDYQIKEKQQENEIYKQHYTELLEITKLMASQPINIKTEIKQPMSVERHISTGGGNYIESNNGIYVQGNYTNMSQDLTQAATQIQDLIEQLQKEGFTVETAQEQVARDISTQAHKNSEIKDKLVKWGQSLGNAAFSDVVKGAVKLAIRSAGIPLP
ncbi:MAG: hypothetical protein ACFB2X_16870 [Rivularia sp. (in: cyanobacteria)]